MLDMVNRAMVRTAFIYMLLSSVCHQLIVEHATIVSLYDFASLLSDFRTEQLLYSLESIFGL